MAKYDIEVKISTKDFQGRLREIKRQLRDLAGWTPVDLLIETFAAYAEEIDRLSSLTDVADLVQCWGDAQTLAMGQAVRSRLGSLAAF